MPLSTHGDKRMILLLNGTSSSGKSTLAKYLLKAFDEPFIFHSFDSLVPSLLPHPDSTLL
jgi:chloramphenicol 3-O-phosphotransferase